MANEIDITETQTKLLSYLSVIEDAVKQTSVFAAEQMPLLVKEILAWGFWSSLVELLVIVLVLACFYRSAKHLINCWDKYSRFDLEPLIVLGGFVMGTMSIVFVVAAFVDINTLVKVSVAPRVYLLDQIKELKK